MVGSWVTFIMNHALYPGKLIEYAGYTIPGREGDILYLFTILVMFFSLLNFLAIILVWIKGAIEYSDFVKELIEILERYILELTVEIAGFVSLIFLSSPLVKRTRKK